MEYYSSSAEEEDHQSEEGVDTYLEQEEKKIKDALKHTSYETLLKLKKEGNNLNPLSRKIQKRAVQSDPAIKRKKEAEASEAKKKNRSDRPKVKSAKIPVGRFNTVMKPKKLKTRDPRFDEISGTLNKDLFNKSYDFLVGKREKEIQMIQNEVKKKKNKKYSKDEIDTLKEVLAKSKNELASVKKNQVVDSIKKEHNKKVKEAVEKGAKPFYMKQSELNKKVIEKKFDSLGSNKRIERALNEKKMKDSQRKAHELKAMQRKAEIRKQRLQGNN